jgi:hypothetical protein
MTMTINPAFLQGALLRNMVKNPLSGAESTAKVTAEQSSDAARDMLAQRNYGLRKRMNEAQTVEMANRLALSKGYLDIDKGKYDIQEKELGLSEKKFGLDEKKFGLAQQRLGLASQEQNWREKNWRRGYDTENQNLWTTAAIGLGTAGWSAYEGARRAELIREETKKNREAMELWTKYLNKGGTP